jgi:hypothetical protein
MNWINFVKRPNIINLSLNEQKKLFLLEEQRTFNNFINPSQVHGGNVGNVGFSNPLNSLYIIQPGETIEVYGALILNALLIISAGGVLIVNGDIINDYFISNQGGNIYLL